MVKSFFFGLLAGCVICTFFSALIGFNRFFVFNRSFLEVSSTNSDEGIPAKHTLKPLLKSESISSGKIYIDSPEFNFQKKLRGAIVEHTFVIKNNGDAPLEIGLIKAACGCTATQLRDKIIPAGESRPLEVKLNLALQKGSKAKKLLFTPVTLIIRP